MLTTHGDDTYRYRGIELNFSSNICHDTDLTELKAHLASHLDCISSYPEPEAYTLEAMIAEREGVDKRCVVVTNGATEAIYLLAQVLGGANSVIAQPTFSEYETACAIYGHSVGNSGNVVWICNPNNPTGDVIDKDTMSETIKCNNDKFYVIDHAYEDYTTEPLISDAEAVAMHNVAILHSMTKQYAVPGLRLGYVTTNSNMADRIRSMKQPWSVNAIAIEAGLFLIAHGKRPDTTVLIEDAQSLRAMLNSIDGISAMPTKTNFMLATIAKGTAAMLKEYLATRCGILIRDASSFSGLTQRHFRVATQGREADIRLVDSIRKYMEYA